MKRDSNISCSQGFPYSNDVSSMDNFLKLKRDILFARRGALTDLSMINLDLPVPRLGLDALTESILDVKNHKYSTSRGVRKTREAFARKYQSLTSISFDPESEVLITSGTKDALMLFLSSVSSPGDTILCLAPTYPVFGYVAAFLGLNVITTTIDEVLNHSQKFDSVKAILLNTPNNPQGNIISELENLLSLFPEIPVFNDFIYGELYSGLRGERAESIHTYRNKKNCVESYSLSKAYAVSGWRIGGVVGDAFIIHKMADKKSQVDYGVFLPIQHASVTLLDKGQSIVVDHSEIFKRRASSVIRELSSCGGVAEHVSGVPFVWVKFQFDVTDFIRELLILEGICVLPGVVFGDKFSNCIRIALVQNEDVLSRCMEKLSYLITSQNSYSIRSST